jgi:bifunctional DNA-binding transcriptional regulator/antitoxin component of YhaV-PrlF toxin-antitoxin module
MVMVNLLLTIPKHIQKQKMIKQKRKVKIIKTIPKQKVESHFWIQSYKEFCESLSYQNKKAAKKTERQRRAKNPEKLFKENEKKLQKWKTKINPKTI